MFKTFLQEDPCSESKIEESRVWKPFLKSFRKDPLNGRGFKNGYHASNSIKPTNVCEYTRPNQPSYPSLSFCSNGDLREFVFREREKVLIFEVMGFV